MGQKYKNCYFRLKCYFCKCAEIKSWHIYVWSQHLCKRLDSSHDVLRPKTNIPTPFTPRITVFCRSQWTQAPMIRWDSGVSVFRMGPAASGRGLCDIERVIFRVTKSRVEKLRKYTDYNLNRKSQVIGIFSSCLDFPIFWYDITQSAFAGCRTHMKYRRHGFSPTYDLESVVKMG